jgi:dolichyl-phosphate-mannose-protein mannosyltransferase
LPAIPFPEDQKLGRPIKNGALVKFHHVVTDTVLLSHDVASPQFPTNQEFTTTSTDLANGAKHNDTIFEIKIEKAKSKTELRTLSTLIKVLHNPSKVAMWTHTKPLPDWAFKQMEINGNKNVAQSSNIWFFEDIPSLKPDDPRINKAPRKVKTMPFLKKYLELQRAMFHHNNALTSSHPYASQPIQWPFLLRGVSFWTKNATRQQIYFLGNPVGWWLASSLLAVLAGIFGADQLTQRRGIDALDKKTRSKLYNSTGFFLLAWAAHYFPFFLMGRQLFLHHYLPAHLSSTLVTGALVEFVFCSDRHHREEVDQDGKKRIVSSQSFVAAWIAALVITVITVGGYLFFAPLTYGTPGLDVAGVNARKWLGYELHFAK